MTKLRLTSMPLLLGWLLLLSPMACSGGSGDLPPTATASLSGYNHTPEHIGQYYVDGQWGGNIYAYGGGGSFVCCLVYPRKWREGLSAKVRWTTSSSNPSDPNVNVVDWHEQTVPIEKYEKTGTVLNVHFLPDHKVRLIIWNGQAVGEDYPGPQAPDPPPDWPPWGHSMEGQHEGAGQVKVQAETMKRVPPAAPPKLD